MANTITKNQVIISNDTLKKIKVALTDIKCNSDNKDVLIAVKVIESLLKDLKK
jgi:hypothetical protein